MDAGSVLELVQEEMVIPHAELLVDERGVAAVDDASQNGIGIVNAHHVLLLHKLIEGILQFACETERVNLAEQCQSGLVGLVVIGEKIAEMAERLLQNPLHRCPEARFALGEPQVRTGRIPEESLRRGRDCLIAVHFRIVPDPGQEFPVELLGLHSGLVQCIQHRGRSTRDFPGKSVNDFAAAFPEPDQILSGINLPVVQVKAFGKCTVSLIVQGRSHLIQLIFNGESPIRVELFHHAVRQPLEQILILLGKGIEDSVDALLHKGGLVEFDLI